MDEPESSEQILEQSEEAVRWRARALANPSGMVGGTHFNAGGTQILYSDDRVDMRHINLGSNYHFTPESRFDFYAGVLLSWVGYSSSTFYFPEPDYDLQVKYDDELAWGLNFGADFAFGEGSSWFASVQGRYLFLALEGDSNVERLTVDPFEGFFGIGYRW